MVSPKGEGRDGESTYRKVVLEMGWKGERRLGVLKEGRKLQYGSDAREEEGKNTIQPWNCRQKNIIRSRRELKR